MVFLGRNLRKNVVKVINGINPIAVKKVKLGFELYEIERSINDRGFNKPKNVERYLKSINRMKL